MFTSFFDRTALASASLSLSTGGASYKLTLLETLSESLLTAGYLPRVLRDLARGARAVRGGARGGRARPRAARREGPRATRARTRRAGRARAACARV